MHRSTACGKTPWSSAIEVDSDTPSLGSGTTSSEARTFAANKISILPQPDISPPTPSTPTSHIQCTSTSSNSFGPSTTSNTSTNSASSTSSTSSSASTTAAPPATSTTSNTSTASSTSTTPANSNTFVPLRPSTTPSPPAANTDFQHATPSPSDLHESHHQQRLPDHGKSASNTPSQSSEPHTYTTKIKSLTAASDQLLQDYVANLSAGELATSPAAQPRVLLYDVQKAQLDGSKLQLRAHREQLAETIRSRARPYDPENRARREQRALALLNRDEKHAKCGTLQSHESKRHGRRLYHRFYCGDILGCRRCNARYISELRRRFDLSRKRQLDKRSRNTNALKSLHEYTGTFTAPHRDDDPAQQTTRLLAAKGKLTDALRRYLKKKYPAVLPFCAWFFMLDWAPGHPHLHWWALLPWPVIRWLNKQWMRALRSCGFDTGSLKTVEVPEKCCKFRLPAFQFTLLDGLSEDEARSRRHYVIKSPIKRKHFIDSDYLAERHEAQVALTPFSRTKLDLPSRGFLIPKRQR